MSNNKKQTTVERCAAAVWKRDTYRYTGRSKGGFEMHYNRKQCSRRAVTNGLCSQHAKPGAYVVMWERPMHNHRF